MLKSRPEVAEIHCVKDAKVPLMRFKFDGILVDLPYARLNILSVPEVSVELCIRFDIANTFSQLNVYNFFVFYFLFTHFK